MSLKPGRIAEFALPLSSLHGERALVRPQRAIRPSLKLPHRVVDTQLDGVL